MAWYQTIFIATLITVTVSYPSTKITDGLPFTFEDRQAWGARPPVATSSLDLPVPYVLIHHSYIPDACFTADDCKQAMRSMQDYHQLHQGWSDIGYNFAVGANGVVYEGRGWNTVGAHAVGYNARSIGIVLIGDWRTQLPPAGQLEATKDLIKLGVKLGFISSEYSLISHRQVSATECPGDALFSEITTWDRFTEL